MNAKETSVIQNIIQNEGHYLQLFFDQMQEAYALHEMVFDSQGQPSDYIFLEGNSRFEELTGLSFEQIKGRTILDVLPDTDPELIRKYGQVVLSGEPFQDIIYVKEADKYYNVSAFRVGKTYFATLFYDVTQQEKTKRKLERADQEQERLLAEYETVFNATKEAIFLMEVLPDQKTTVFIRNNLYHQQATGLTMEMIAGKTPVELLGPEVGGFVAGNYQRCIDAGSTIRYEEELDLIGGKRIWRTELHPIIKDNNVRYIVGSSTDITEMREKEKKLEMALQKAEEASKIKGIFLTTINHEFRTPMNTIIGLAHLIKNTLRKKDHPEVMLYLQDIQSSAQELLLAITDILDYADLTLSETEIKQQPVSLFRMVREAERFYSDELSRKTLDFTVNVEDSFSDIYLGDDELLKKVIFHIIGNAIKYTSDGAVEVALSKSEKSEDSDEVQIVVSDTGVGISPDKISKVFEPFIQEDNQTNRRFQGVGLGLPIVRGIVERMQGEISLSPGQDGKGTVAEVRIPMKKQEITSKKYMYNIISQSVDYDDTLKKLGGNKDIYHDILQRYEDFADSIIQIIIEVVETGQIDELRLQLHNLKGMSLNIGAVKMVETVIGLERLCKETEDLSDELDKLVIEFEKVRSEIRWILKKNKDGSTPADKKLKKGKPNKIENKGYSEEAHALVKQIYEMTEAHSLIEEEVLEQAKQELKYSPQSYILFSKIITQLDAFDYQNAKKGLVGLLKKMDGDRRGN